MQIGIVIRHVENQPLKPGFIEAVYSTFFPFVAGVIIKEHFARIKCQFIKNRDSFIYV